MQEPAQPRQTTPRLAAYHEAGHAVACFFEPLAGRTTRISIRDADLDEGDAGVHCCVGHRFSRAARWKVVRALAVVTLAGTEVDRRLTGNRFTSGSDDYEAVRKLFFDAILNREIEEAVAVVSPGEIRGKGLEGTAGSIATTIETHLEQLFEEARNEARRLIDAKWLHVEAVAEALLEREVLSGDAVHRIIEAVERRRGPHEGGAPKPRSKAPAASATP